MGHRVSIMLDRCRSFLSILFVLGVSVFPAPSSSTAKNEDARTPLEPEPVQPEQVVAELLTPETSSSTGLLIVYDTGKRSGSRTGPSAYQDGDWTRKLVVLR